MNPFSASCALSALVLPCLRLSTVSPETSVLVDRTRDRQATAAHAMAAPSWSTPASLGPQTGKGDPDAVKVLKEWLAAYAQGEIDMSKRQRLRGKVFLAKNLISVRRGLLPEHKAGGLSFEEELRLICAEVAKRDDGPAAAVLLEAASVGLEGKTIDPGLVPSVVRKIGAEYAAKLTTAEAVQTLVVAARGEGGKGASRQAVALRVLGAQGPAAHRGLCEQMLGHAVPEVRIGAADALGIAAQPAAVSALASRLDVEAEERVATVLVDALTATVASSGVKVPPEHLAAALDAALAAYRRHGWRYQIAALDFLAVARSPRSVPALIETLARYHGKDPPTGDEASGMVPDRAHRLLLGLTKCVFPANRADQWQAWWKENGATLQVEASTEPIRLERLGKTKDATVANAFFGIPVSGSRVVFVVDISGSMHYPLVRRAGDGDDTHYATKWELARAELRAAIDRLSVDCSFNVIFFSANAEGWKPKLVPATAANKKAFLAHLDKVNPDGGTNVWAGLQLALNPKSIDPSVRVAAELDELFVLSDGLPSLGDVVDPRHILQTMQTVNEVSKIRVNTVYIGGDEEAEAQRTRGQPRWDLDGPEFMRRLASENGGQFLLR